MGIPELLREIVWIVYKVVTMSYEGFVTIVLTAVAVMLAGIGLMIGIMAIWGFAEARKFLHARVEEAVKKAMGAWPTPEEIMERSMERVASMIVSTPSPKAVANASDGGVKQQVTGSLPIEKYPGKEPPDASSRAGNGPVQTDAGPNNN